MVLEFIDKVKAKGIIASGKDDKAYFGSTSNDWKVIDFLNEVPIVNEQEIVKPYFERLKQVMKERNEDNGGEPLNGIDKGYDLAFKHMCLEIDKILSEKGNQ